MGLRLNPHRFYFRLWFYSLPMLSFAVAFYLRFRHDGHHWTGSESRFYLGVFAFVLLVWTFTAERQRLCRIEDLFKEYTGIRKCLASCCITYAALMCFLFFFRQESMSRIALALSAVLLFTGSLLSRFVCRLVLDKRFQHDRRLRVLIIGVDDYAARIANHLQRSPVCACEVVAHVRLEGQTIKTATVPVCDLADLPKGLPCPVDDVIIALAPERLNELSNVVRRLGTIPAPIRTVLDLGDIAVIRERWFQFGDLQLLDVGVTPIESPWYFLAKRIFDIAFSIAILSLMTPILLIIALLIKLTSKGPILFKQERVGLNGKQFWIYKFRTMEHADRSTSDIQWTTPQNPRRTSVGAFLRKASLDELPQFFNVLKGDMSVVGPRPERPYFVDRFLQEISFYNARHRLKVGITGWAQVNGWRGDTSIQKRFEFDLYYLQNWSLWFDLRIIWMTICSGLFDKNAY